MPLAAQRGAGLLHGRTAMLNKKTPHNQFPFASAVSDAEVYGSCVERRGVVAVWGTHA